MANPSILATAVIPWKPDLTFDASLFSRQIGLIAKGLTRYIYTFGTAGEGYAVTEAQFDAVLRTFWEASNEHGVTPMVGIISLSLPTVVNRIERAREMGFRDFQISLPSWGALNDSELDAFFSETCGRFRDCRFNHYNLLRSRRLLTAKEYRRIAEAHPNLVGVKCSSDDPAILADLLTMAPRLRFYLTEFGYARARQSTSDVGLLASLATANYTQAHAFVKGGDAERTAAVAELRQMVSALRELAADRFHMDGAFDKMLFRLTDPEFPLRLLPPYATASEDAFNRFREALPPRWRQPQT